MILLVCSRGGDCHTVRLHQGTGRPLPYTDVAHPPPLHRTLAACTPLGLGKVAPQLLRLLQSRGRTVLVYLHFPVLFLTFVENIQEIMHPRQFNGERLVQPE